MRLRNFLRFSCLLLLVLALPVRAEENAAFSFGSIAPARFTADERAELRETIRQADEANLAFVVAHGITHTDMPCDDTSYQRRLDLIGSSKHGLVVAPAASDWAACGNGSGASAALARLTRVREMFSDGEFSLGATRLPLVRQSTEARFNSFVENARWELGNVMFATLNIPANNNHFVMAAGRNGEFEDRLVANKEWLRRIFTYGRLKKLDLVVIFTDANPLVRTPRVKRDGYLEVRRQIQTLATTFPGHVLIVHGQAGDASHEPSIKWRGRLGEIGTGRKWLRFDVKTAPAASSRRPPAPVTVVAGH